MIEKVTKFVSKILFGKEFLDGYIKEPETKEEYELVSLFPNELAKSKAMHVLNKDHVKAS